MLLSKRRNNRFQSPARSRHAIAYISSAADALRDFLRHALGHAPHGKVRVGRRAQLAKGKRLAQVEGRQHAPIIAVRDDVLRHVRVPGRQLSPQSARRVHRPAIFGLETGLHNAARHGIAQRAGQPLRRLRHHAVTLELGVRALIHDQVKSIVDMFQLAQGNIVASQAFEQRIGQGCLACRSADEATDHAQRLAVTPVPEAIQRRGENPRFAVLVVVHQTHHVPPPCPSPEWRRGGVRAGLNPLLVSISTPPARHTSPASGFRRAPRLGLLSATFLNLLLNQRRPHFSKLRAPFCRV